MKSFNYTRRLSSIVRIGNTPLGGNNPIRIQSMTNTSTMDTVGSVQQCIRIIEAGADYVRLTAQGVREAENLQNIKAGLHDRGYFTPLIADIHFNPKAAEAAAKVVEKVRINPGNFVDPVKTFRHFEYTDEEYAKELEKIRERFIPFLNDCKINHTAIRIGVNHGSLSDRIMSRYGDTPEGMVESCMEFLRICVSEIFPDVVISIKASNTYVMVRTVRLLVEQMDKEGMAFPLHLGVTEAGDGEDGRIKSAVGIGTLLWEGIGDTIRVSLSEDPELEIPVARQLIEHICLRPEEKQIKGKPSRFYNPIYPERRSTNIIKNIGGHHVPVVISDCSKAIAYRTTPEFTPDYLYIGTKSPELFPSDANFIADYPDNELKSIFEKKVYFRYLPKQSKQWKESQAEIKFIELQYDDLNNDLLEHLKTDSNSVILLKSTHSNPVGEQKAVIHRLLEEKITVPVIIKNQYTESEAESLQIKSGSDYGPFFLDMLIDGIMLQNEGHLTQANIDACAFGILQASGRRISKTEYISCPSCGRTLFNLQNTIRKVKEATSHLKGLKIGIMGCIVNGPGEMADADYGYVGAASGKISLYKGKNCIEKNIPEEKAVERLIEIIKEYGDWQEVEIKS